MRIKRNLFLFIIIALAVFLLASCLLPRTKEHTVYFINEACIKPYKDYTYRTCDNLYVLIDGDEYVIPKNFKTNLASIPRILWTFYPPQYASYIAPAIVHDFFYHCPNGVDRRFADEVFYDALRSQGVSSRTAIKFYTAVRLFGFVHFDKNNQCYEGVKLSSDEFEMDWRLKGESWTS